METTQTIEREDRAKKNFRLASEIFDFCVRVKKYQLKKKYPQMDEKALQRMTMDLIDEACRR